MQLASFVLCPVRASVVCQLQSVNVNISFQIVISDFFISLFSRAVGVGVIDDKTDSLTALFIDYIDGGSEKTLVQPVCHAGWSGVKQVYPHHGSRQQAQD